MGAEKQSQHGGRETESTWGQRNRVNMGAEKQANMGQTNIVNIGAGN